MGINWNRCFTCQLHELKNTTFCVWSWRNARAYNPGYNTHSTFRFDDVSHPGYGVYIIYGQTNVHREALQVMKAEIEGKLVGLERAVIDTR